MRLLPFSKQMDVSCLLPITFKMWLVLLEGVLNERDAARCFQGWRSVRGFLQQKEDTFFPGFSLPMQVSLSLSWFFGCLGFQLCLFLHNLSLQSVNCRSTFGMCMEDSRDGCVTDPWPSHCGHKGFF